MSLMDHMIDVNGVNQLGGEFYDLGERYKTLLDQVDAEAERASTEGMVGDNQLKFHSVTSTISPTMIKQAMKVMGFGEGAKKMATNTVNTDKELASNYNVKS
ncbi:hypothetical protein D6853_15025 [Butyrivibrio sp. X503]|uniref:hypothetical protein n=1 Tax=Butyrivibrio sp. X503 TaxID=2364878 RepID=UPI000EA8E653|nr:hypothetical protein [Butyrivibrio sp. X503]RKM53848.1 hypothetical protein D6853_15025 [Butyrivibrio sp. X503]